MQRNCISILSLKKHKGNGTKTWRTVDNALNRKHVERPQTLSQLTTTYVRVNLKLPMNLITTSRLFVPTI